MDITEAQRHREREEIELRRRIIVLMDDFQKFEDGKIELSTESFEFMLQLVMNKMSNADKLDLVREILAGPGTHKHDMFDNIFGGRL